MQANIYSVRDSIGSYQTIKKLEQKGISATSFPIVKVNYKRCPNFKSDYKFIVITSSKSIKMFLKFIKLYKKKIIKKIKVFVVGPETAKKLKTNNMFNIYQADGNSRSLTNLIIENTDKYNTGLWFCGRNRNDTFLNFLFVRKRFIHTAVVYEMLPRRNISSYLIDKLKKNHPNFFIVNSSRNIFLLTSVLKKHQLFDSLINTSKIVVMSKKIYNEAANLGWKNNLLIDEVVGDQFLDKLILLLKGKSL